MPLLRWSSVQSACARYAVAKSDVARVARGHRCESHALKLSRNQTFRACVRTGSRVGAISASELFGGVSRGIGGSRACQAIGPGLSGHAEPTGSGRRAAQSSASGFAHILAKCQGWSTSEGTGGGRWCERRTAVCGWGAGGGVARGRGAGAGERLCTPVGAIFSRWQSPRLSSLHHLQTQIPSTGDAVGFPTRGSTHGAILDDNTSSSLQYRTPFPSASRSAAVRSSSCAARLSTCGAPCAHRW